MLTGKKLTALSIDVETRRFVMLSLLKAKTIRLCPCELAFHLPDLMSQDNKSPL